MKAEIKKASFVLPKECCRVFLLWAFLLPSCAPPLSPLTPPENYKGPIADGPTLQVGDYWVYQQADGRKVKLGAGRMLGNVGFPLWLGKTWSYEADAMRLGQPVPTNSLRSAVRVECTAAEFKRVAVLAGGFEAFECTCQCNNPLPQYSPDCGRWTFWYAPEVKNIIKVKTQSTASSVELLEFKISNRVR